MSEHTPNPRDKQTLDTVETMVALSDGVLMTLLRPFVRPSVKERVAVLEDQVRRLEDRIVYHVEHQAKLLDDVYAANPEPEGEIHGETCPKVSHEGLTGTLHAADYDGPYDVDGGRYCGRCHVALPHLQWSRHEDTENFYCHSEAGEMPEAVAKLFDALRNIRDCYDDGTEEREEWTTHVATVRQLVEEQKRLKWDRERALERAEGWERRFNTMADCYDQADARADQATARAEQAEREREGLRSSLGFWEQRFREVERERDEYLSSHIGARDYYVAKEELREARQRIRELEEDRRDADRMRMQAIRERDRLKDANARLHNDVDALERANTRLASTPDSPSAESE